MKIVKYLRMKQKEPGVYTVLGSGEVVVYKDVEKLFAHWNRTDEYRYPIISVTDFLFGGRMEERLGLSKEEIDTIFKMDDWLCENGAYYFHLKGEKHEQ